MCSSRLSVTVLLVLFIGSFGTAVRGAGNATSSGSPAEVARARLTDTHQDLMTGFLAVEAEKERVAGRSPLAKATLAAYRLQYQRHLAKVWALEREWRTIRSIQDLETLTDYLDRVSRVQQTALRLSSNFSSNGLGRVRRLDAKAQGVALAPAGASLCYGSIAGTVRGYQIGPLAGVTVTAYTADGAPWGTGLTQADGGYQIDDLLPGDYYVVTTNSVGLIDQVFYDVPCPGSSCDPSIGVPVTASTGNVTSGIDIFLDEGGTISGTIVSLPGPSPLLSGVAIYDLSGNFVVSALNDIFTGQYQIVTGLDSVFHYVVTQSYSDYLDELYNDIPCTAGALCDPVAGDKVFVRQGEDVGGINFALEIGGTIAGNVIATDTGFPVPGVLVGIHDDAGSLFTFGQTDGLGDYVNLYGLGTGTYYAATGNVLGYRDELYDGLPCPGGLCTITGGTQIDVVVGQQRTDVDFALEAGGKVSGTVTDKSTGEPLESVFILTYDSNGGQVDITGTNSNGEYLTIVGLGTGNYHTTTLNPYGFDDELYDGFSCPLGICNATVGTPIAVTLGQETEDIDFDLAGGTMGACDFEECSLCDLTSTP